MTRPPITDFITGTRDIQQIMAEISAWITETVTNASINGLFQQLGTVCALSGIRVVQAAYG
jgi:hypothetical protein